MRNAERGTRNSRGRSRAKTPTVLFRVPPSAFRVCLLLAACTPVTTRPDFKPDPRALVVMLNARPERVTVALDSLLPADSLEVARFNVRDGYVESSWYDPARRRSYRHERDIAGRSAAGPTPGSPSRRGSPSSPSTGRGSIRRAPSGISK